MKHHHPVPSAQHGLSTAEVNARIASGKINAVEEQTSRSIASILRANLATRFNALFGALLIVVFIVGSPLDAIFGLIIIINSAIGIIQELRAKLTLDRLALLNVQQVQALRDGALTTIAAHEIVEDDVVELRTGDQVPADGRVLSTEGLEIDESLLSGESNPIFKKVRDEVRSGSIVVAGTGRMRATKVGAASYAHTLSVQVKRFSPVRSELQSGINRLLGYISWIILFMGPLLVWGQVVHSGNDWREALIRSVAGITGMIPEGLVLLTSLAFGVAAVTLARKKVLVQQLPAVEGLAKVDSICLDKTGTLTEGTMRFEELVVIDHHVKPRPVLAAFAQVEDSPTMKALHEAFLDETPVKATISVPFSSQRKWSALSAQHHHWILGAPSVILPAAERELLAQVDAIARRGRRVMLLMRAAKAPTPQTLPGDRQPVALVVLAEKVRPDAKATLQFFMEQGAALKILSGDNPQTIAAVAREVGLPEQNVVDAKHLPDDLDELAAIAEGHTLFGRVSPEQKREIVRALQSVGHSVAVTGDGVNDALALKQADIGIAMGSGAPATRAVADVVLLDNQFAHLPQVLAEGRRVMANIERVASLFIIKNVYSLVLALAVTISGLPYPFLPRHLTVMTALTIGIPAFFLALAPNDRRYQPGFLWRVLRFSIPVGMVIAGLIFISYSLVAPDDSAELASTTSAGVVMMAGVWVLYRLARPLNWKKILLIVAMPIIFISLVVGQASSDLLDFEASREYLVINLLLGLVGMAIIELLWRRNRSFAK